MNTNGGTRHDRLSSLARRTAAVAVLILMGYSSSALALSWNSAATPLTVTGYGSTGKGHGTWTISTGTDGTRYRTSASLYLINADNHKVYAKTSNYSNSGVCFAPDYTSCQQSFYLHNTSETTHYNVAKTWKTFSSSAAVNGTADYHRAAINVKLDVPWKADPSSGATWTTGIKY